MAVTPTYTATMRELINQLKEEVIASNPGNKEEVETFRLTYVAKQGRIAQLFNEFKQVAPEDRKAVGALLNELKDLATEKWKLAQENLTSSTPLVGAPLDITLPGLADQAGAMHPLTLVRQEVFRIFSSIGFNLSEGPEIEDDWHNFGALNFPDNHPAREMQDTFFIARNPDVLLRTHTSTVQVRVMEGQQPPIRTLSPGRVYRNEAISARAHCLFHQVEGLYINEGVSFKDLKDTLYYFVKELFSPDTKIRFRPSFFPFTEPSAEIDISCQICHGDGCNICKHTGWVEIGGSGMVDPAVLEASGIDAERYTGFAFGMGLERMAMLKYGVKDLRLFTENDVRFLRQFSSQV